MSQWHSNWEKSIRANQLLMQDRERGENAFSGLISTDKLDGMLYYSRGEAYEYLRLWDLAFADYGTAEIRMPAPHWKNVAKGAALRVAHKRNFKRFVTTHRVGESIHRVYATAQAPHRLRVDTLMAIEMYYLSPRLTAATLRCCLEYLVIYLTQSELDDATDFRLLDRINELKLDSVISPDVAALMHKIRKIGNRATHPNGNVRLALFYEALRDFPEVMDRVFSSPDGPPNSMPQEKSRV